MLPSNLGFGRIVGRFLTAAVDTSDPDSDPEAVAAVGQVTFTPSVTHVVVPGVIPPVTLAMTPVSCTLDPDGYLIDGQGNQGVSLIASNDPDMTPTDWTYAVVVSINNNAVSLNFSISVTADTVQDLSTLIPVPAAGGTFYTQGPAGWSAYQVAVANGFVGTEEEWLASLQANPTIVPVAYDEWPVVDQQPGVLYVRTAT